MEGQDYFRPLCAEEGLGIDFRGDYFYSKKVLEDAPDFANRGALPHHEEIAVDEDGAKRHNPLYQAVGPDGDPANRRYFANQFRWRKNTAIEHIRQAFTKNWHR